MSAYAKHPLARSFKENKDFGQYRPSILHQLILPAFQPDEPNAWPPRGQTQLDPTLFMPQFNYDPRRSGEPPAVAVAAADKPFGSQVKVCHNGCVIVRINDRGPFVRGRHIDLTPAAARAIGLDDVGQVTLALE